MQGSWFVQPAVLSTVIYKASKNMQVGFLSSNYCPSLHTQKHATSTLSLCSNKVSFWYADAPFYRLFLG